MLAPIAVEQDRVIAGHHTGEKWVSQTFNSGGGRKFRSIRQWSGIGGRDRMTPQEQGDGNTETPAQSDKFNRGFH